MFSSMRFMRYLKKISIVLCVLFIFACSLPPQVLVTKQQLDDTRLYGRFVIEENPDALIYAINQKGVVIVRAYYRNVPVYIIVFATSKGILWYVYPRER